MIDNSALANYMGLLRTATHLERVHRAVEAAVNSRLRPFGMSVTQFRVLEALAGESHTITSVGRLATLLGVHHTTSSHAVDVLCGRNLARREKDLADRRRVAVSITTDGIGYLEDARTALNGSVDCDAPSLIRLLS